MHSPWRTSDLGFPTSAGETPAATPVTSRPANRRRFWAKALGIWALEIGRSGPGVGAVGHGSSFLGRAVLEHTLSEEEHSQIVQTIEMFEVILQTQPDDYQ